MWFLQHHAIIQGSVTVVFFLHRVSLITCGCLNRGLLEYNTDIAWPFYCVFCYYSPWLCHRLLPSITSTPLWNTKYMFPFLGWRLMMGISRDSYASIVFHTTPASCYSPQHSPHHITAYDFISYTNFLCQSNFNDWKILWWVDTLFAILPCPCFVDFFVHLSPHVQYLNHLVSILYSRHGQLCVGAI
jgi:hypothetical protein